jgi:hypothetical protein
MKKAASKRAKGAEVAKAASAAKIVSPGDADEMRPEYDFRGGVRGKYAARYTEGTNLVLLDPDVARAFPDAAVNDALRALVGIIERTRKPPRPRSRRSPA